MAAMRVILTCILLQCCGAFCRQVTTIHQMKSDSMKTADSRPNCTDNCDPSSVHHFKEYSSSQMDSMVVEMDNTKNPEDENKENNENQENKENKESEESVEIDTSVDVVDRRNGRFPPRNDRHHYMPDGYLQYLIARFTSPSYSMFDDGYGYEDISTNAAYASDVETHERSKRSLLDEEESARDYRVVYMKKPKQKARAAKPLKIKDVEILDKSLLREIGTRKHGGNYMAAPQAKEYYEEDYDYE